MEITTRDDKNCTIVEIGGQLDRTTAPQVEARLQGLIDSSETSRIVLDLSGVPEMSSAGLRVIISAVKRLRSSRSGGDLRLAAPGKRVASVLELAGLLPVMQVYDTVEEAVESFQTWGKPR